MRYSQAMIDAMNKAGKQQLAALGKDTKGNTLPSATTLGRGGSQQPDKPPATTLGMGGSTAPVGTKLSQGSATSTNFNPNPSSGGGAMQSTRRRGSTPSNSLAGLAAVKNAVAGALGNAGNNAAADKRALPVGRAGIAASNLGSAETQGNRLESAYSSVHNWYDKQQAQADAAGAPKAYNFFTNDPLVKGYFEEKGKSDAAAHTFGQQQANFMKEMANAKTPEAKAEIQRRMDQYKTTPEYEAGLSGMMNLGTAMAPSGVVKNGLGNAASGVADVLSQDKMIMKYVDAVRKQLTKANKTAMSEVEAKRLASTVFKDGLPAESVQSLAMKLNKEGVLQGSNVKVLSDHYTGLSGKAAVTPTPEAPKPAKPPTAAQAEAAAQSGVKLTPPEVTKKTQDISRAWREAKGWTPKAPENSPVYHAEGEGNPFNIRGDSPAPQRVVAPIGNRTPIAQKVAPEAPNFTTHGEPYGATGPRQNPTPGEWQGPPAPRDPSVPRFVGDIRPAFRGADKFWGSGWGAAAGLGAIAAPGIYSAITDPSVSPTPTSDFQTYAAQQAAANADPYDLAIQALDGSTVPGTETPPVETPPVEAPPVETPPVETVPSMASGVGTDIYSGAGGLPEWLGGGSGAGSTNYPYSNIGGGQNAVESGYAQLDANGNPVYSQLPEWLGGAPGGQSPTAPGNPLLRNVTAGNAPSDLPEWLGGNPGVQSPTDTAPPPGGAGADPSFVNPPYGGNPPKEDPQGDIMQQILDANQPYLDSQNKAIDEATELRIQQMREQYAARGIYNADALATEEDRIREEGEAQKDALFGQVLAGAYQTAMQYDFQNKQLEQSSQIETQKAETQARQWAAEMGLNYQKLDLQTQQMFLDEAYRQNQLNIDWYSATHRGAGATATAQNKALDSVMQEAMLALKSNASDAQVINFVKGRAAAAGASSADIISLLQAIKAYKTLPQYQPQQIQ